MAARKRLICRSVGHRPDVELLFDVDYSKIITIEPGKRSGKPCIRGMRITVQDVFEYLAGGMTEDQILQDFPELTREDINACFAFAADRERKLFVAPA
jgi:uncharacterized protein (DUF433 family)